MAIDEDLRGAFANFTAAGIHRGKLPGQTIQKLYPVKAGKANSARHIKTLIKAAETVGKNS